MKRRNEVTVGILLTVAVLILITGTLWLVRGGLRSGYPLFTRFPWGQNLKQGQAVMLAGVTVGYVSDVKLNADGYLDVDLSVNDEYRVPRNAVAEVYPVGIFGDVAIALKPTGPSPISYEPGDTVPSRVATSGLDALQARADTIMVSLGRVARTFEAEFVQSGGMRDLRQTVTSMNRLVTQLSGIATEQNRNFSATLATLRRTASGADSARVASAITALTRTSASIDSLTQRLSSNTTQLQALLARLERGEGTAGKLLTDTLLYRDARNLLARTDSLLADFQKNPRKYINLSVF